MKDSRKIKITTEKQYDAALEEILRLWDAKAGTPESERRHKLVDAVAQYEDARWPMGAVAR